MGTLFRNQSYISEILKHRTLPVYKTYEFSFFRCVNVEDWVYGRTISHLHSENLRINKNIGRYSRLFPDEKISYWADSKSTALAEIKKHKGSKNYITFNAYDDASSTFPTLDVESHLVIADGRDINFHKILLKVEQGQELTKTEIAIVDLIKEQNLDCLAYYSEAKPGRTNFLFFEQGFKKLALRDVRLYFGENKSKNAKTIPCAITCDYSPILESYGMYFEPIVKVGYDSKYSESEEYISRNLIKEMFKERLMNR